jgi:hypothetical protein
MIQKMVKRCLPKWCWTWGPLIAIVIGAVYVVRTIKTDLKNEQSSN